MDLEQVLLATPASTWRTDLAIIFDWYDGPREGFCRLSHPAVEFRFRLADERPTPDGLDERLLRLDQLPPGAVEQARTLLRGLGDPVNPVWVPVWRFASDEERARAESGLRAIEDMARPTSVVILTQDLYAFLGCWAVAEQAGASDWFASLGIPRKQTA